MIVCPSAEIYHQRLRSEALQKMIGRLVTRFSMLFPFIYLSLFIIKAVCVEEEQSKSQLRSGDLVWKFGHDDYPLRYNLPVDLIYAGDTIDDTVRVPWNTDNFKRMLVLKKTLDNPRDRLFEVILVQDLRQDPTAEKSHSIWLRSALRIYPSDSRLYSIKTKNGAPTLTTKTVLDISDKISLKLTFVGIIGFPDEADDFAAMLAELVEKRKVPENEPARNRWREFGLSFDREGHPDLGEDWPLSEHEESYPVNSVNGPSDSEFLEAYRQLRSEERDTQRDIQELERAGKADADIEKLTGTERAYADLENYRLRHEYLKNLETSVSLDVPPLIREERSEDDVWALAGVIEGIRRGYIFPGEEFFLYSTDLDSPALPE